MFTSSVSAERQHTEPEFKLKSLQIRAQTAMISQARQAPPPHSLNHLTSVISLVEYSYTLCTVHHKETFLIFFCDSYVGKEIREDGLLFFL